MKQDKAPNNQTQFLPIYMCLGLSIGMVIGAAFNNISIGMCMGMGIGVAIGSALDAHNRKNTPNDQDVPKDDNKDNADSDN